MKPGPAPTGQRAATTTVAHLAGTVDFAVVPRPPAGLSEQLRDDWDALWSSSLRLVIGETSLPALRRLFALRQESADAHRDCVDSPMLTGSQDQEVLNPRCRQATELDKEIRQLEDRFGLNPAAFVKLGLTSLAAEEASRRAEAEAKKTEAAERGQRPDPRA